MLLNEAENISQAHQRPRGRQLHAIITAGQVADELHEVPRRHELVASAMICQLLLDPRDDLRDTRKLIF